MKKTIQAHELQSARTGLNLIDFYRQMVIIRIVEQSFLDYFSRGQIKGTVHISTGQEACAVGVMNAIDKELDIVFSSHRAHGHLIAYGCPLDKLIAEVFGKSTGVCKGIGGTQHIHWRNFFTNGIQGAVVPIAVGAAFAEKRKQTGALVVVFLGDGTMGQGVVYEGFNMSALWDLPIVFVLENNQYAQSTPVRLAHSGVLENRAKPFDIYTKVVDGNRVGEVYNEAVEMMEYVRTNAKPAFLVLQTYRLGPHSKGDDFRDPKEIENNRKRDPLKLAAEMIHKEELEKIGAEIPTMVEELFGKAINDDNPTIEVLIQDGSLNHLP